MTNASELDDVFGDAVRILTAAARRTRDNGSPCDFADFLSGALASAAANVGGVEQLLTGRSGSREASHVRSLLTGTVGFHPDDLASARTEPIVVTLNIAEMLEHLDLHPGLLTLAEALAACDERHADDDPESLVVDEELAEIEQRYDREFSAYAERFTTAVAAAAQLIPGLQVPVIVKVDTDPWSYWWSKGATVNVLPCDDNVVAVDLWHAAHAVVTLPNIDIQIHSLISSRSEGVR